ncbi:hypothetical protein PACTADRAFT_51472 [Pachysolen tannophilus NRRL Y-2460]|uniref:Serine/threonine-protein kinase ATG1 n=1 Tax=Pachysolen tannophilus NRRL Y-2460 TaxID=669874 RepID=A0A1E4TPN0_PACTA|nr:hypothetical protein PACTADRAFT_51472 [Pachysolen tannophilus NRRL Y-2460]
MSQRSSSSSSAKHQMAAPAAHQQQQQHQQVVGQYIIGPEIGKGSFANVYKGYDKYTNQTVAIKSVFRSKLKNKKLLENLEVEISILKTLQHPHIVALLDCQQTQQHFHLFMEYCSLGDLSYFIRKRDQLVKTHPLINSILERYPSPVNSHGLNKILVINFLKQLASALEFLRDQNLVHRDIKPQNLLLSYPLHSKKEFSDKHYVGMWELPILKIADFGFARILPNTSLAETLCGSPLYMAPEILRYEKYNAKADLWSVGAVLYEMAVGHPPFKASNHVELLRKIERTKDKIVFPQSAQVSEDVIRLICGLLKCNPTERMGFQEFFQDSLILSDLRSSEEPLDGTNLDENLFISEYLPNNNHSQQHNLVQRGSKKAQSSSSNSSNNNIDAIKEEKSLSPGDSLLITASRNTATKSHEEIKSFAEDKIPSGEDFTNSITSKAKNNNINNQKDDIVVERDYVVVEKRTVEVNALADELRHAGNAGKVNANHNQSYALDSHSRSGSGGASGNAGDVTNGAGSSHNKSNAIAIQSPTNLIRRYSSSSRSSSGTSNRRPSFNERRVSISISPTNALTKALGAASTRLFGGQISSPYVIENANVANSTNNQSNINNKQLAASSSFFVNKEDLEIISSLESLATKAHAISLFAEVKFSQLLPLPPSSSDSAVTDSDSKTYLPPSMIKTICEEGVVLYVKALSLLSKAMDLASQWWGKNNNKQLNPRLIELVEWIRERFNSALEKAEFLRSKLNESNKALNINSISLSSQIQIIPEKLIFTRALEIARKAAEDEAKQIDLQNCELSYSTSIWMLEAILDQDSNDEDVVILDDDDKSQVERYIVTIGNRLNVLRKKLDQLEENSSNSVDNKVNREFEEVDG